MLRYTNIIRFMCFVVGYIVVLGENKVEYIGFRYNNTGYFPKDVAPPVDFDGVSGKNLLWKKPLPNFGNSSPIVVPLSRGGARVFVLCDHGWPLGDGDTPALLCFDADTGAMLWKKRIDPLDTLTEKEAEPLRKARHQYWYHQHEVAKLFYRYHFEARDEKEKEVLKQEALKHAPGRGNFNPVNVFTDNRGKSLRLSHEAALTHSECSLLNKNKNIIGQSSWNWTGIGQAMCTPVSDGKAVYVVTGLGTVTKFDMDGNVIWHIWDRETTRTEFYECWLANGLYILPIRTKTQTKNVLVFELFNILWAYDCADGRVIWKVPTDGRGGHVCGTPQLLRLKGANNEEELFMVTRSGHIIRVFDGKLFVEGLFNVNYHGPISDGYDRVWIKQVGGDGGHFHPVPGSVFNKKCVSGLRFSLKGEELIYEKIFYDEQNFKEYVIPDWLGFVRGDKLITKNLMIGDAMTGKKIKDCPRDFDSYNGTILAGGYFYAIPKMIKENQKKGDGDVESDYIIVCCVARDGDSIESLGRRRVEIIKAVPEEKEKKEQRIALTGRIFPGEWYHWHGAYSAPFAYQNKLYIRTFDNLYCFGER